MALNGIDLAGALIAANSTNNAYVSYQNITNISGARLETKIANVVPKPDAMDASFQRQVTNPTALHSGFAASNECVDLNYATRADTNSGYILPRTNPPSSNPTNTNSDWRNLHTNMFQMKWVNVYKGNTNDPTNLIGRFAFWVDDESTKLNINYSGHTVNGTKDEQYYSASNNFDNSGRSIVALYGPRADKSSGQGLGVEFEGSLWPLVMDLGGVAGISRTNAGEILTKRGDPNWRFDNSPNTKYSPYYSILETRLGTLPPAIGGLAITNIMEQSQLGFTATVYSREPEITYATGRPRFDLFNFNRTWSTNASRMAAAEHGFTNSLGEIYDGFTNTLNKNYPEFDSKYSLPQFVAAIKSVITPFGSESAAATNITYIPSGNETVNFNARLIPLINETEFILKTRSNGTNNIATLEASVELIFLNKVSGNHDDKWFDHNKTMFDDLGVNGSFFASNKSRYESKITFDPPLIIGTNSVTYVNLFPNNSKWFTITKNTTDSHKALKPYGRTNTNEAKINRLEGLFAILTSTVEFTNTNTTENNRIVWEVPLNQQVNTKIFYNGTTNVNGASLHYQSVNASYSSGNANSSGSPVLKTNMLINSSNNLPEVVYWWTSVPRGDLGVRGDPRLGLHSAQFVSSAESINTLGSYTNNPNSTIYKVNTDNTWRPGDFANATLSPDITPPNILFDQDKGFNYSQQPKVPPLGVHFMSSGDLGEIPITTYRNNHHLAWSTPKFWGDGRTNMGDAQAYPPDWLMLDCVHTAMFPPNTNRPFSTYSTNHVSYGRLNINGLKSYFQVPKGLTNRPDTILDSLLVEVKTKDFRDVDNFDLDTWGRKWTTISRTDSYRTNLINYINNEVLSRGSSNTPFLTGFEFAAHLAGNTNFPRTVPNNNLWSWHFYNPNETSEANFTTDSRIESLVRSLQQRVTSRGFQFSVFSLGQSLQVVKTGETYKTNVIGESYFQAVWERAPKHNLDGTINNASLGGAPPLRLLYMRELR
jgi:hypothetical protein